MNSGDLLALAPLLIVAIAAQVVMLAVAFFRSHRLTAFMTLAALAVAGAALAVAWPLAPRQVTPLLMIDHFTLFCLGLILAAAGAVVMFSYDYMKSPCESEAAPVLPTPPRREEYYILLLLATAGAAVLVVSAHFASFLLGLEILSVALYALIAYPRTNPLSIEGGIKYLILAGASSAFVVFGMALVYAALGTLEFAHLATPAAGAAVDCPLAMAGLGLIVVGIAFKLSLAPFHFWAPDVYQGAPAPVTAFVATVSKGAMIVLLLRLVMVVSFQQHATLTAVLTVLAIISMFVGNGLALLQKNVKRLLAYSSISHMGYLLVAMIAGGTWATLAVTYYLTAYFVTMLGAFGVVAFLSCGARDADTLEEYRGLAWRRPWVAGVFTLMLFSLAGIPLTAGFIGKFYVVAAGVQANRWLLVGALVVNSAIGLFYYLRVIIAMFGEPDPANASVPASDDPNKKRQPLACIALFILTVVLLWLGLTPAPAVRLIQAIVREAQEQVNLSRPGESTFRDVPGSLSNDN